MKNLTKITIVASALMMVSAFESAAQSEATYKITFTSLWNKRDHLKVPGNAHFSPLVVVSHNEDYTLFPKGNRANKALEDVAELGKTGKITTELKSAVRRDRALTYKITKNQFVPKTPVQTLTIKVSKDFPLLSMVTMIAPSPDWVVGLNSLMLVDGRGNFVDNVRNMSLYAYNAGTEDGDKGGNFSINNPATKRQERIRRLNGNGFRAPFAKVKVERVK